jgi:hypothetical protein
MPILWKRLASGFAVAVLFVAFARSLGFDWVPTQADICPLYYESEHRHFG